MTPERYARIKTLFARAAEIDAGQRDVFLTRQCRDDVELRAEIEALLAHDDSQTIISGKDKTIADFPRETIVDSKRPTLMVRLQGWNTLTRFLGPRGHLAMGALLASVVLACFAYLGHRGVLRFQRELRRQGLNEIVDGKVLAIEMWVEHEVERIDSWARSEQLNGHIEELVIFANESDDFVDDLRQSPLQKVIRQELHSLAGREVNYSIWDRSHRLVADQFPGVERIGESANPWGASILASVFEGESRFLSFDNQNVITDFDASVEVEPHVGTITPVSDEDGHIIAAVLIHDLESRQKATRILGMIRAGESGETYLFNRDGMMLSASRFDDQLRDIGLIPEDFESTSARRLYLRDPGGDLTKGYVPDEPLSAMPLTRMARLCTSGIDGDDLHGYRDYRGVKVVGAWRWLDELDVGVVTELDLDESEPGLHIFFWETWVIVSLFAVCMGIALYSYYSVSRLRQQVGENGRLGQYVLEKQIGEGGMGKVFKARHELLKRPTAVKLLKPELIDRNSTARFEREARLVSQLEHRNTIRIFDYGVTPHGIFFYVMEYIDGLSLRELVELESGLLPERVIYLLRQICGSLREAHEARLVHRDLKPANIMVCQRGGESDVVKVLDFGLVKHVETSTSQQITSTAMVAGTPQYIAPERLSDMETNDPRSDLYSLGAVAFFLLTGRDYIKGGSMAEVLFQIVNVPPVRPSKVCKAGIPKDLDELVYRCLAKEPDDRPSSAAEIISLLDSIQPAHPWLESDADSWWDDYECRFKAPV